MKSRNETFYTAHTTEASSLILRIEGGSRTARERLIADVKERQSSKTDPLFRSRTFDRREHNGITTIGTMIFATNPDLIDRLMQRHQNVTVLAVRCFEGDARIEQVRYEHGHRVGEWAVNVLDGVEVVTVASGAVEDIATFGATTQSAESANIRDVDLLVAMRTSEQGREFDVRRARLNHRLPALESVIPMSYALSQMFPRLRLAFFAIPQRESLSGAEAVFADGRIVTAWHSNDSREEIAENAGQCWEEAAHASTAVHSGQGGR